MVSPAQRRDWVRWVIEAYRVSEGRASRATGAALSSFRYKSSRSPDAPLRQRLRELAAVRVSYGYQRLHVLLQREGWRINRKRTYRLDREEGLALRRSRPKRRRSAVARVAPAPVGRANERWAMDFVHDSLAGGGTIRVLTVLDVYTRECVALEAARSFRGEDVARTSSLLPATKDNSQGRSASTTELSSLLALSITGRTGTKCSSTSRDPGNRRTMPSSRALTRA